MGDTFCSGRLLKEVFLSVKIQICSLYWWSNPKVSKMGMLSFTWKVKAAEAEKVMVLRSWSLCSMVTGPWCKKKAQGLT